MNYVKPEVKTLKATEIVELLGPVQGYGGGPREELEQLSKPNFRLSRR